VREPRNTVATDPYLNGQKKRRAPTARPLGRTSATPSGRSHRVVEPRDLADVLENTSNWHAVEVTPTTWMFLLPEGPSQTIFAKALASRTSLKLTQEQQDRLYDFLKQVIESAPEPKQASRNPCREALTPRQLQIARMISVGASNKVVARALGLTVGTVKVHLHRMYQVLGISSRVELAILLRMND
jgi:DNA-binding CsgD family transcriptional regulator